LLKKRTYVVEFNELKSITSQFKVIDMCRKLELQCQWHQSRRHTSMFTMFRSTNDRVTFVDNVSSRTKVTQRPQLIIKNNFNR